MKRKRERGERKKIKDKHREKQTKKSRGKRVDLHSFECLTTNKSGRRATPIKKRQRWLLRWRHRPVDFSLFVLFSLPLARSRTLKQSLPHCRFGTEHPRPDVFPMIFNSFCVHSASAPPQKSLQRKQNSWKIYEEIQGKQKEANNPSTTMNRPRNVASSLRDCHSCRLRLAGTA